MKTTALQRDFTGKKVALVGLGLQGGASGVAALLAPIVDELIVTDLRAESELAPSVKKLAQYPTIRFEFGTHKESTMLWADCIIIGPSVPWGMKQLTAARKKGIAVLSEMELFFMYNTRPIIGVTGTRGKTTTTLLIQSALMADKQRILTGGNIPGSSTLSLLEKEGDIILLELSSWQLSGLHRIKKSPHIAVFTNLFPDHLNFYPSMKEYMYDKQAIFQYQTIDDYVVINDSLQRQIQHKTIMSRVSYFSKHTYEGPLTIIGDHNRENVGAAMKVCDILHVSKKAKKAVTHFKGVAYRLQKIATIRSVDIYNDTTSTTPVAGIKALEALGSNYAHVILIAGGNSKNLPIDDWVYAANMHAEKIVCIAGTFTDQILKKLRPSKLLNTHALNDLPKAFMCAMESAQKQNTAIVFSPSATSFAMFKNEFDRGEQFNAIVQTYEQKEN